MAETNKINVTVKGEKISFNAIPGATKYTVLVDGKEVISGKPVDVYVRIKSSK